MTPKRHESEEDLEPRRRAEDSEITLPFGIKLRGLASKAFMSSLPWLVAVGSIGWASYGPPQQMMLMLGEIKGQLVSIEKRLDKLEAAKGSRRTADIAALKRPD